MKKSRPQTSIAFILFLLAQITMTALLTFDSISARESLFNHSVPQESWIQNLSMTSNQGFENGKWLEIGHNSAAGGGISNNNGRSDNPSVAIGADGMPVVAWADEASGNGEIYVRRWNGSAWAEIGEGSAHGGGISDTDSYSDEPSLAIAPDGQPVIAWKESTGGENREIYVRRWNGTEWSEMGMGSATGGGISNTPSQSSNPSLAIGSDGMPIVAWSDYSGDPAPQIFVLRWNGSNWVEIGDNSASGEGISASTDYSVMPSLAISSDNVPTIAWWEIEIPSEFSKIYVRRWSGAAWVEVGVGSASGGGIGNSIGWSRKPSLAIDPDGAPVVTWSDYYSTRVIYIRRWDGIIWDELGSGSASGPGISQSIPDSNEVALAMISQGYPFVAWQGGYDNEREIFVRRWNGEAWIDMGVESSSGGGISNTEQDSMEPSVATGSDDRPIVAWREYVSQQYDITQIYVRRWQPAPIADFMASQTTGLLPLTVDFTNLSSGDFTECLWEFGDGRTNATCANPSITFNKPGGYTISLTVTGAGGTDSLTKIDYIRAGNTTYLPSLFAPE